MLIPLKRTMWKWLPRTFGSKQVGIAVTKMEGSENRALEQLGKVKGQNILKPDGISPGFWKRSCLKLLR